MLEQHDTTTASCSSWTSLPENNYWPEKKRKKKHH